MVQASQMTGNGTMQIWKYYKDSFMYKEHAYLLYPDSSIKFLNEKYQFFDGQGNIIETFYIGKNDGTHDTTNHSISKYVYDDNMNITSRIDKTKDYTGNWVGSLKEDYAYNAENVITENAKYLWNRSNNFWYKYHNSIYEYDSSSKMSKKKYYTSKDSVTWDPINLTTFDYTECNNISHEFFYIWDTLISDFVLGSFKNYYWQKYFYDENTEDTNEDFVSAIYPNPSANYFNLIFESEMAGQGVIEIHDVSGKIIFQENIKVQKQVNNYTWDASNVPSGLYFMNISMGDLHKIMKIVKYP
jgi:hypothetical protein